MMLDTVGGLYRILGKGRQVCILSTCKGALDVGTD